MLVTEAVFKWLLKYLPNLKADGPKDSFDNIQLSADSSLSFQNGVSFFELFQKLAEETNNKTVTQHLAKLKIIKSQARIAIISNLTNLTPIFRNFNVPFDDNRKDRIANSGFSISYCVYLEFLSFSTYYFFRGASCCRFNRCPLLFRKWCYIITNTGTCIQNTTFNTFHWGSNPWRSRLITVSDKHRTYTCYSWRISWHSFGWCFRSPHKSSHRFSGLIPYTGSRSK